MAGQGAAIGGTIGSVAGSLIPGLGTAVGGAAGSGIGSFIDSVVAKRQGESAEPGLTDPNQLLILDEISRKRKAMEAGTDTASQTGLKEAEETGAATRDVLSRSTGGDVGSTVDALLKSQRMEERGKAGALASTQSKIPFYQGLEEQLGSAVSQRKLDLQMFNRVNQAAQEAQFGKEAVMNLMAGTATGQYDPLFQGAATGMQKAGQRLGDFSNTLIDFFKEQIGSIRGKTSNATTPGQTPQNFDYTSFLETFPKPVEVIKGL